jgi:hypothetical protein
MGILALVVEVVVVGAVLVVEVVVLRDVVVLNSTSFISIFCVLGSNLYMSVGSSLEPHAELNKANKNKNVSLKIKMPALPITRCYFY